MIGILAKSRQRWQAGKAKEKHFAIQQNSPSQDVHSCDTLISIFEQMNKEIGNANMALDKAVVFKALGDPTRLRVLITQGRRVYSPPIPFHKIHKSLPMKLSLFGRTFAEIDEQFETEIILTSDVLERFSSDIWRLVEYIEAAQKRLPKRYYSLRVISSPNRLIIKHDKNITKKEAVH